MENITYFNGKCKKISDLYFYDKRVDIWSLGICLYELIFNLLPFININNVNDLEKFYRMSSIGEIMNKKITKKTFLHENLKCILLGMLQVRINKRFSIDQVLTTVNKSLFIEEKTEIECVNDIINIKEHNYKLNEDMKQHVIKNPISIIYSWEHISANEIEINENVVKNDNDKNTFLNGNCCIQ